MLLLLLLQVPEGKACGFGSTFPSFWIAESCLLGGGAAGGGAGGGGGDGRRQAHFAFQAPSRAKVREFYAAALAAGGQGNGAPGFRPQVRRHAVSVSSEHGCAVVSCAVSWCAGALCDVLCLTVGGLAGRTRLQLKYRNRPPTKAAPGTPRPLTRCFHTKPPCAPEPSPTRSRITVPSNVLRSLRTGSGRL